MPTYRDHICLIRNACFPIVFENISLRIRNIQSILRNLNMYIETKCLKNENIVKLCVVLGNTSTFFSTSTSSRRTELTICALFSTDYGEAKKVIHIFVVFKQFNWFGVYYTVLAVCNSASSYTSTRYMLTIYYVHLVF